MDSKITEILNEYVYQNRITKSDLIQSLVVKFLKSGETKNPSTLIDHSTARKRSDVP
jgi:hypothetical protein